MSGEDTRCTNCGHNWNHHSFSGMCRYADMTGDECGCHSFSAQPAVAPSSGENTREALVEALRVARRWIYEGGAQIGWDLDRLDAVIAREAASRLAAPVGEKYHPESEGEVIAKWLGTLPAAPPPPAEAREDWRRRYEDEYAIVDRVWKALGVTTYDGGPAIDERVAALRAQVQTLTERLRAYENHEAADHVAEASTQAGGHQ